MFHRLKTKSLKLTKEARASACQETMLTTQDTPSQIDLSWPAPKVPSIRFQEESLCLFQWQAWAKAKAKTKLKM